MQSSRGNVEISQIPSEFQPNHKELNQTEGNWFDSYDVVDNCDGNGAIMIR